jgi:hypothetical protein
VADASPIEFAGRSYPTQGDYLGILPESLEQSVGTHFDALVGADILNRYDMAIDPTAQSFDMTDEELSITEPNIELNDFMGIPIIEAMVGGDRVLMFFDTGAKLSYLDSGKTDEFESFGTETDFYPGIGEFSTNVYDVPISLADETIVLCVGNLPQLLQMTLMMADTGGILGTAILNTHKVTFAPRRRKLALERLNR